MDKAAGTDCLVESSFVRLHPEAAEAYPVLEALLQLHLEAAVACPVQEALRLLEVLESPMAVLQQEEPEELEELLSAQLGLVEQGAPGEDLGPQIQRKKERKSQRREPQKDNASHYSSKLARI